MNGSAGRDDIGVLQPGKAADIIALRLDTLGQCWRSRPRSGRRRDLLHATDDRSFRHQWTAVVEDGQVLSPTSLPWLSATTLCACQLYAGAL